MKLVSVYDHPGADHALYKIMVQRLKEPGTNISHKTLPTAKEHVDFFDGRPYAGWYLIMGTRGVEEIMGAIYITHDDEIGIYLWQHWRGKGFAEEAVREVMRLHPADQYLAHIHPQNQASANLFKRLGFGLIQHTYAREKP